MQLWEQQKSVPLGYQRRAPEKNPLYRLVSSCGNELIRSWEDQFESTYGALRHEVSKSFEAYLQCGILAHGCARATCDSCGHSEFIAFSCKKRGVCPSCDAKRSVLFAENLVNNVLLPASHQHLVFTIPKRIRPYFKFDRSNLQFLYSAAWQSLKSLVLELYPDATPAAVLALHSAGELLNWHPHLHGIFLSEALGPDGTFRPLNLDPAQITARFAKNVLSALLKEELLTQEVIDNMLSWEHSGFNVHLGDPIPHTDTNQLLFVARYLRKCPVSNERITLRSPDQNCQVVYHSYKNNKHESRSFSPLEFLAELSCHIPDVWEQTTRFYGLYSCRTRGAQNLSASEPPQQPNILLGPPPEPLTTSSASWARCLKRIFEFDPLKCPSCPGTMKIRAFITDPSQIDRITKHAGTPNQRAPPNLKFMPLCAA